MSVSISYSFNLDTATQAPTRPADLHAFDGVRLFRLSDGNCSALNPHNRKRAIVRDNTLALFSLCDRFRTLAEHRDTVSGKFAGSGLSDAEIMSVLEHMKDAGLMISADRWLEQFPDTPIEPTETADWVLAIITCDRPALLRRLLESAAPYLTDARPARVLLLDDSRRQDNIRANRACWADWLARCGLSGEYWGRAERARLCRAMSQDFPERSETIDWLFAPDAFPDEAFTVGQNRNLALLLSAGRRLLMLDDDCYLDPHRHPLCNDRLQVGFEPVEVVPYTDRETMMRDTHALGINPFAEHLRFLGVSLRQAFERTGMPWHDPAWLKALDGTTISSLNPDAAVRITCNATLGDPGTASMNWLYSSPEGSSTRIADYLQAQPDAVERERLFWKGRFMHGMDRGGILMTTTLTGVDNRMLLPCVLPTGRSDDDVLGHGIFLLHGGAYSFSFNWALPHSPEPPRYWRRPCSESNPSPPSSDWLLNRLVTPLRDTFTPEVRLHDLASRYRVIAASTDTGLTDMVEHCHLQHLAAKLTDYQHSITSGQALNRLWQQDVSTLIENVFSQLSRPLDSSADWLTEFRIRAARHADALGIWPRLREWATQRGDAAMGSRHD